MLEEKIYSESDDNIFLEYYHHLKVYDCEKKIRIGNKFDGGYVISDIGEYDCYISAGVGDDESFSKELIEKYNLKIDNCFSFDNTIEKKPKNYPVGMKHVSLNISDTNNLFETNLLNFFSNKKNVFLKMDIEGGELNWLSFVDKTILSKIKQMVIEFHDLDTNKNEVIEILKKINETHYLIHTHANNYAHIKNLIPSVIELTFLRKTEFKNEPELNTNVLPSSIDYPNNKEAVDIDLNYEPFVFKQNFIENKMKLFEFYGLRRSGLHAIMNWVLCNFTNCDKFKRLGNYFSYAGNLLFVDNFEKKMGKDLLFVLEVVKPKIIIILYEDKDLNFSVLSESNLNISEKNKFTIYRSLENTIASRIKFNEKNTDFKLSLDDIIFNQWVENVNYNNSICYENWLTDKIYRDKISEKFEISNKDIMNNVSFNGGGSSFIGVDLDSKENLLNRNKMVEMDDKILEKIKHYISKVTT